MNMNNKDIKTFCSELETKMKEKLEVFQLEESDLGVRCNKAIVLMVSLLNELKDFVRTYEFKEQVEEIFFFKQLKPVFLSQYFFYERVLSLKINEPPAIGGNSIAYYINELEQLQYFSKANSDFIQYCLSESSQFDDKYFVRGFVAPTDFITDREFSTGYDQRLSSIIANRLLKEHIIAVVEGHKASGDVTGSSLTWTGSKADLIELIYALETVGAINKGAADIKEIARRFETLFNISLGNFYRQFLDIRLRKKEKTTFLNQMKEKLEVRINDFS